MSAVKTSVCTLYPLVTAFDGSKKIPKISVTREVIVRSTYILEYLYFHQLQRKESIPVVDLANTRKGYVTQKEEYDSAEFFLWKPEVRCRSWFSLCALMLTVLLSVSLIRNGDNYVLEVSSRCCCHYRRSEGGLSG